MKAIRTPTDDTTRDEAATKAIGYAQSVTVSSSFTNSIDPSSSQEATRHAYSSM